MAWPKALNPAGVIEDLKRRITSIQEQWRGTSRENEQLRKENDQLRQQRKRIPEKVDEVIAVPPPTHCSDPNCGGTLEIEDTQSQFQQEIVGKTLWRRFDIPVCRCTLCHRRVQGRHPLQTSDALGAAAVQLGPEALALGVQMNNVQM